jgi:hypothetical protein
MGERTAKARAHAVDRRISARAQDLPSNEAWKLALRVWASEVDVFSVV